MTLVYVLGTQSFLECNGSVVVVLPIGGSIDVLIAYTATIFIEVFFRDGCDGLLIDELFDVLCYGSHGPRLVAQLGVESLDEVDDHGVQTHMVQP